MKDHEMFFILRHDVDSPFVYRKGLFKRTLNKIYLSYPALPGKELFPGHLEALRLALEIEEEYNAKGTFFFRTVTLPTRNLQAKIIQNGHEIAFHADRITTFQEFQEDLNILLEKTKCRILGFTKHGFAKVRGGGEWNENKMIEYANLARLKYLAQGVEHPDWDGPRMVKGVYSFGHHLTVWNSTLDDMITYIKNGKSPMLLLHPEDLFIDGVKDKFIAILKVAKAITVSTALGLAQ
ncbi:MAG: hypothetical protein ACRD9Q_03150 [Nitrososphaeraceae archaeon]